MFSEVSITLPDGYIRTTSPEQLLRETAEVELLVVDVTSNLPGITQENRNLHPARYIAKAHTNAISTLVPEWVKDQVFGEVFTTSTFRRLRRMSTPLND